mmetsp:Transcript_47467/g.70648  ORF Transcript_47467/g.70648 Transcript_47467/m.70648 type:complete len:85 (+) Transcript_47467:650-904(+)
MSLAEFSTTCCVSGPCMAELWRDNVANVTDQYGIECLQTAVDGGVMNGFVRSCFARTDITALRMRKKLPLSPAFACRPITKVAN